MRLIQINPEPAICRMRPAPAGRARHQRAVAEAAALCAEGNAHRLSLGRRSFAAAPPWLDALPSISAIALPGRRASLSHRLDDHGEETQYARHVQSDTALSGFSSIASGFWRAAERLRDQAGKETESATLRTHWSVPAVICLYHTAIDCFINEEVTLFEALARIDPTAAAQKIQGNTLNAQKLDDFYSHCRLGKLPEEVRRRTLLLIGLRNRLAHHWPQQRDVRDYPVGVIDALADAKIEPILTSWVARCSDVRLAKWAAAVTRAFVDEWWRQARQPDEMERSQWASGPDWTWPKTGTAEAPS
jgi:hypothetical protein